MSGKNGYYNEDGIEELWNGQFLHCEDGPAIVYNGTKQWYLYNKLHRVGGPAIIHNNGRKLWYLYGKLHREDGPAVVWPNGRQEWWLNGIRHRVGGPAIVCADGREEWYIEGVLVTGSVLEYMKKMSSEIKQQKQEIKQLNQELCDPRIQTMLLYGDRETNIQQLDR